MNGEGFLASSSTTSTVSNDQIASEVIKSPSSQWLKDEYSVYAMYVIRQRALMSQDGLKPVNRRIIWDMFTNNNLPSSRFVKAARIVGSTMGRFHPHGDSSISDAMARMAQSVTMRVPLVDKSGTVGAFTGDVPAAPRYWEARLTKAALELVREVKEGAVEIGRNFDGTEDEPHLLPVRWPNNIVNGTEGIAVGFASKIPPHNPDEVIAAALASLRNPDLTTDELLDIIPGPDFPTGGEILGSDGIRDYMETGKGTFSVRARYNIEPMTRGRSQIVFYELPYSISAEKIIEEIHLGQNGKQGERGSKPVPPNPIISRGVSKVQDLSDMKRGVRFVVTTTQGTNVKTLLNELFKRTSLQSSFPVNSTVLVDTMPVQVSMMDMLKGFLDLRRECTTRRCRHRISKIDTRLHQLNAILAVLIDIDKAISIIRKSSDSSTARTNLKRSFKIDDTQADFILSMQLRRLTKADSLAVEKEKKTLEKEKDELEQILADPQKLDALVEKDLNDVLPVISSERRSIINGATSNELKEQAKVEAAASKESAKNTPCYLTRFADGTLLKSAEPFSYDAGLKKFTNTPVVEQIKMMSKDQFVIVGSDGIGRKVPLSYLIPETPMTVKDMGVNLPSGVSVVGISKVQSGKSDTGLAVATALGQIKIARTDFPTSFDEFPVISLSDGDEVVSTRWIGKSVKDTLFSLVTSGGNVLLFDASSVNPTGSKAGGVKGIKLKTNEDRVVAFDWVPDPKSPDAVLVTSTGHTIKHTPLSDIPKKGRAGQGVATQIMRSGENSIISAYTGSGAVACTTTKAHAGISLPEPAKRSSRGTECTSKVILGAREVVTM